MAKIKLDLVKFQNNYRVVAQLDSVLDSGASISYATKDESLAEDVLNFTRKVINAVDEMGETPEIEVGKTDDGDYMILATIGDVEHSLNVDTQLDAYEIFEFLNTVTPF